MAGSNRSRDHHIEYGRLVAWLPFKLETKLIKTMDSEDDEAGDESTDVGDTHQSDSE